ncbi:DUF2382 domain-containing protein [Aquipuribacter nitratireducens]|uniref:DUF2382 domain-containing protein n=1 Tax=Aquipuribacter nitratireducens TaxID=650104 RepID=A0ABW0GQ42_9MICO
MISDTDVTRLTHSTVRSTDGDKIGSVRTVYLDDDTDQPAWVSVMTGLLGTSESLVPLDRAELQGDDVVVPYDKKTVKDAPNVEPGGHISREEERDLYGYYGLAYDSVGTGEQAAAGDTPDTGTFAGTTTGTDGRETYGDRTEDVARSGRHAGTDDAMTVSEERLRVGTEQREAGRARLRKYVTTDTEQVEVPVTKEEVRVEREPVTDENRDEALAGPDISEDEHEVVVHEERPVVGTETVPKERVRLEKETATETEEVSGQVRKEHVDVDDERR